MKIKLAEPADIERVKTCTLAAYDEYVALLGKKPAPMLADFAALIHAKTVYMSVTNDDKLMGLIEFFPAKQKMFIQNIVVSSEYQGQGVAKSLLNFCEAEVKKINLSTLELYTNEKMLDNLKIYPALGFIETKRCEEDGHRRVYFQKHL